MCVKFSCKSRVGEIASVFNPVHFCKQIDRNRQTEKQIEKKNNMNILKNSQRKSQCFSIQFKFENKYKINYMNMYICKDKQIKLEKQKVILIQFIFTNRQT